MARRRRVGDDELFEIATYLGTPEVQTEIHAELPAGQREIFEQEYADATDGYPLPDAADRREPYYVWSPGTNKQGRQLRIYFVRVPPEPPPIRDLYTDYNRWHGRPNRFRINHSNLVMQLFQCGFVLGPNDSNSDRIAEFMRRRFPVRG